MLQYSKLLNGFFSSFLYLIINTTYSFLSIPILLAHFGKEKFGVVGLVMSINFYLKLADSGFSIGNVKYFSTYLAKDDFINVKKLFQTSLGIYLIIGTTNTAILLIITIFSENIFKVTPSENYLLKQLLYIVTFTTIFSWITNVFEQFLKAKELIGWSQNVLIFFKFLQFLLVFFVIYLEMSVYAFFLINTLLAVAIFIPYFVKIRHETIEIDFIPKIDMAILKEILPYSLNVLAFVVFQFSAYHIRPLLLGMRLGPESITDYRILEGFGTLILSISAIFMNLLLPLASKLKVEMNRKFELELAYNGTRYLSIFTSLIIFAIVLVSKEIIIVYVGVKYVYLEIWLNVWMLTSLSTHNYILSTLVLADNQLKPIVYSSAMIVPFSLILSWILIPYFGIGGVVIGFVVYHALLLVFYYFYYYPKYMKYDSKHIFIYSFINPLIAFLLVYFTMKFIKDKYLLGTPIETILKTLSLYTFISFLVIKFILIKRNDKTFFIKVLNYRKDFR